MSKETYFNGLPIESGQMIQARELLIEAGISTGLNNFGPYTTKKIGRIFTVVNTFKIGAYEFTVIETEAINLGFTPNISTPRKKIECWFQPLH